MRTVAHLSDLHFGRHDETVAERLLADISEVQPDLVVVTGDLTQRARHRQFAAARAFLERFPMPIIVVPGNHDVPLYDVLERFIGRLARYRRYICTELQPFYADDEIALLGLNTARSATFTDGRISYRQAAALKAVFAEVPADRLRILAIHHPLGAPAGASDVALVGRAAMARNAVTGAGVRVVLSGHHHRALSGSLSGSELVAEGSILLVHAGTAISTRLRGEPNSYNLLRVEPTYVTCAVRAFSGNGFVVAGTANYLLLGGRWKRH
ncbi:MAG: metallophosphoesterase [Alphaproteobacteria bacterium]|nr:metallophosphoesterase [Alphaproteobacteria bacterium]